MSSPATDPTRPSGQPQQLLPAPVATLRTRRRPDLTLSIPQRDSSLALPLLSTASSSVPYSSPSSVPASTSSPSQKTPQFSDLERLRCIASSPEGAVWTVRDRPTGRHYVLKSIRGDHDDAVRRRIRREIELRRSYDSRFVVHCHGVHDQGGEIQVLLEYMDGGSLEDRRIASEPCLADVARQALDGLAYLHARKIVHRDISPSSLLIDTANQVKIADFGLFSRIFAQTLDLRYMSPERISTDLDFGKIYDGYAGDVWSFGLSILEIYLGRFPFGEDVGKHGDWASLIHAICYSDPPAAPPTASPELRSFISRCLQKEPSSRPTAAQLLQHPFIRRTHPPLHPPIPSPGHGG